MLPRLPEAAWDHRNAGQQLPPSLCRQGTCFCSPKEAEVWASLLYLFALVCWFWQRLQILSNEFLLSFSPFRMSDSEIRLLGIRTGLSFLILPWSPVSLGQRWTRRETSLPFPGLAHLSFSAFRLFCLVNWRSPPCNSTVSLCLCAFAQVALSFLQALLLSCLADSYLICSSGLGDHISWQCPHLSYIFIWVKGPSYLLPDASHLTGINW